MAFQVNIDAPAEQDEVDNPVTASGTIGNFVPGNGAGGDGALDAMWYQVDNGDAFTIDNFQPDGTGTWSVTLANVAAGAHVLSVYARSTGGTGGQSNPPDLQSADRNFSVNAVVNTLGGGPC